MKKFESLVLVAVLGLTSAIAAGEHGLFEKPLWNYGKANRSTRGSSSGKLATRLYMMQPKGYMTGARNSVGVRFTLQDENAATTETCTMSYVRFDKSGIGPDTSATGTIASIKVRLFGQGMKDTVAFDYTISFGRQVALPAHFGLAIDLPANSSWPADGASMHAQLNLPNDSRRPRVAAPHDKHVWAFEAASSTARATPLGGRTLDVLQITAQYTEPVFQPYVRSKAYGLGYELLYGPEAYFPVAARGDQFGAYVDAGSSFADAWVVVMVAPRLSSSPLPFPPRTTPQRYFYLDLVAPFPLTWIVGRLDFFGGFEIGRQPFASVPPGFRDFWMQAIVVEPKQSLVELTGAVRLRGQ